ncbi:zinc finger protein 638 [Colossoma macropomum]|uniref:zinc finger protein 638 n=1 Tax=Colossoma macropomum TaxID=42526 RepID=UPI001864907F|nr:zinc finger protein 638 [Colossoma macropomum]XP_036451939.1 zinc finger protein 638 [Colossoma macropomum]
MIKGNKELSAKDEVANTTTNNTNKQINNLPLVARRDATNRFALFLESCVPPVTNSLSNFRSPPLFGPASLQLAQIKAQLALHQLNVIAAGNITPPFIASPALTLLNLLKVTMSHPMYNPRGGPFSSGQRSMVTGQYGLGSQTGGARLGPDSMSSPHGGMMVNQQMTFPLAQRQPHVSQDLDAAIDMNIRGAREEVRLLTQMLQQPKSADPRLRKDIGDEVLPPGGSGYTVSSVRGRSDDVDWTVYQAPGKLFASSNIGHSSSSSQLFQSSGFGNSGGPRSLDSKPPPELQPTRYTSESASSILASFGLSSEDLELLSHYPDDQLTPDNLPFILRDIRMRKAKRSVPDPDLRTSSDLLVSETRQSKVIDYGHSSKFGFPEEKSDSYSHDRLTKEPSKYEREVSGSSFSDVDITKRPLQNPAVQVPVQAPVMVPKLQQPPAMNPRSASQSLEIQGAKTIPGRLPTATPIPPPVSRPPQMPPPLAVGPLAPMIPLDSGSPKLSWPPAFPPTSVTAPAAKRLPTPTMMNDYSAATPRIFPHTCSLCNIECIQIKDWIEHQNTNLHIESCRRLRKQYPDWNVEAISVTSAEPKLERRSPKRHGHSRSYSRSPSPKRHHGSSSRRQRSRSRSRSPRRYRRSRSRSRSRSPPRKTRGGSPSYRRRSRTPPGRRSRSPGYSSSRRSPVRSSRRVSPRRNSPSRQQRSSSSERLAKKLLQSSELSSVTSSSSLKAMVQSLAPALLAELAKKRNSSSSPSVKSSSSRKRSSSPSAKRSESSKSSSSSAPKTSSSKSDKSKKPAGPGTSCLLRLKGIPLGTTHQELVTAVEPFGKIHTAILLKAISEASVCMEKEEDAKALARCQDLKLRGKLIEICMEKDARDEPRDSKHQKKTVVKKKDHNTTRTPQPSKVKGVTGKTAQAAKFKDMPKTSAKGKQAVKAKPPAKGPGETPVKRIVKKEIPWRRNIVEITGLPEKGVTEEDLKNLASPHGFVSTPVIAVTQQKAYLEMPNTQAAEALVKTYAETPAKLQEKEINITMMTRPIDLNYTESLFRVLMGMEKLPPQEIAVLPERLLTVGNVPNGTGAINEVQNLIKRFGSYRQTLPLNGRIIFEMNSAAIARSVYSRFLKFPCIIQNKNLTFKLAKMPKASDQMKMKPDAKGAKPVPKVGVRPRAKAKPKPTKAPAPNVTSVPTSASPPGTICAEVVTAKAEDTAQNEAKFEVGTSATTETASADIAKAMNASEVDSKVDAPPVVTTPFKNTDSKLDTSTLFERCDSKPDSFTTDTASIKSIAQGENKIDATQTKEITVLATQESGVCHLPTVTTENCEKVPMDTTEQTEKLPMDTTEHKEKVPMDTTEQTEKLPMDTTEHREKAPMDTAEQTKKVPMDTTEHSEKAPMDAIKHSEKAPMDTPGHSAKAPVDKTEHDEKTPMNTTEPDEKVPKDITEHGEKPHMDLTEHDEKAPIDTIESAEIASADSQDLPQAEAATSVENMPLEQDEVTNSGPQQDNIAECLSDGQIGVVGSNDSEEPIFMATSVALEAKSIPVEESTLSSQITQDDLKPPDTMTENEAQIQDDLKVDEPVETDSTLQACDKSQLSEKNNTQPAPVPSDDMTLDFPPVTQEILKALEAAVHQCRLQSSLRRAEEEARQKTEPEKVTDKAHSSTKKHIAADESSQVPKKAVHADCRKTQAAKVKKSQSSASKSKLGDNESPERGSSSRHKQKSSPEVGPPSTRRGGSSSSSTASRNSRSNSSPVSKSSRGHEEDRYKSRSTRRSTRSSRTASKTRKTEKPKEEEEEELFPFNLDEFVTVDEVVDEPGEDTAASTEPSPEHEIAQDELKAPTTASTPAKRHKPEPEKLEVEEPQRAEDDTVSPDILQEAETIKPAIGEPEKTECMPTETSTPEPLSQDENKECSVPTCTEEASLTQKETTENGPSCLLDTNQFDSSATVLKDEPLPASEVQEKESHAKHQTAVHDTEVKEGVNNQVPTIPELPAQDALVTLDEVSEEEEDFPDDEAEEEELLKRQAGENPEALLTVDEVRGDEAEAEEEHLEKELRGLVTLDEIVEEEDDDDDEDSFNPETLVTLDEARGDDEEMDEQDNSKQACSEVETPAVPEEPAGSSGLDEEACDLEALRRMTFVTVDEVGEEEVEQQEEKVEDEVPVTRRGGRPKRRARQTPVRKSSRKKKEKASDQTEETPEMLSLEETASVTDLSSSVTKDEYLKPESQNLKAEVASDSPDSETLTPGTEKHSVDEKEVISKHTRAVSPEKRAAIKEESKQRRDDELNQEPESKRPCSEPSITEDFILPPFSPDNPIGVDFVVPRTGYFCKLCSLFYGSEETAKKTHCSSLRHYQSMQKYYEKLKSQCGTEKTLSSHTSVSD